MKLFLDLSLLVLIVTTVVVNWRRGFIRSVLGTAKTILAVLLTFLFGGDVSAWLETHIVGERVTRYVHERFTAMFDADASTFDLSHVIENLPDWLLTLFQKTNASTSEAGQDFAHMTGADADALRDMAESFAAPISSVISDFLGYAVVFLVSLAVLAILAYLLGKVADLPVLRTCDRLLGLLLGLVCAALFASAYAILLFAVLSLVEGAVETVRFHDAFEATRLFRHVYEWNIFRWIFGLG